MNYGFVKWVKHDALRWFGHVRGVNEDDIEKKKKKCMKEGIRGRLPVK